MVVRGGVDGTVVKDHTEAAVKVDDSDETLKVGSDDKEQKMQKRGGDKQRRGNTNIMQY